MKQETMAASDLARLVLSHEAAASSEPRDIAGAAERASARFRRVLVSVVGLDGFLVLLARAEALAQFGISLAGVRLIAGGTAEGQQRAACVPVVDRPDEDGVRVLAHILGLLVSLIGEALTLGLVCQTWPDLVLDDATFDLAISGEHGVGALGAGRRSPRKPRARRRLVAPHPPRGAAGPTVAPPPAGTTP